MEHQVVDDQRFVVAEQVGERRYANRLLGAQVARPSANR
jgi:hypothetical protein